MTPPALELVDVRAAYGRIEVLNGVSLVVPAGTIVALLGANGAGKTTTLRVIDGRQRATSGCVHIAGRHVNGTAGDRLARIGLCSVPEGRGIFPNLTVEENLAVMAYARAGLRVVDVQERAYNRFPVLRDRRKQPAGRLSGGEQQMLGLARAVGTDPAVLLADELSMGLAPRLVESIYDVLAQLRDEGMTVLVVEQFARTALAVADYVAVMSHGRIVTFCEPAEVEELSGIYLGASA